MFFFDEACSRPNSPPRILTNVKNKMVIFLKASLSIFSHVSIVAINHDRCTALQSAVPMTPSLQHSLVHYHSALPGSSYQHRVAPLLATTLSLHWRQAGALLDTAALLVARARPGQSCRSHHTSAMDIDKRNI